MNNIQLIKITILFLIDIYLILLLLKDLKIFIQSQLPSFQN